MASAVIAVHISKDVSKTAEVRSHLITFFQKGKVCATTAASTKLHLVVFTHFPLTACSQEEERLKRKRGTGLLLSFQENTEV